MTPEEKAKQTAVEWYISEVTINGYTDDEIKERAIQMEKEQIIDAYRKGKIDQLENSELYYNQTYKSK